MSIESKRDRIGRSAGWANLIRSGFALAVAGLVITLGALTNGAGQASAQDQSANKAMSGIVMLEEYKVPGLEVEIAGIYPHLSDDSLYYLAANKAPVYKEGQTPMMPAKFKGKLLTVNRKTGEIVKAFDLVNGQYGGIASNGKDLFVSSLEPAEILQVDPNSGKITNRIPVSGPIGGLDYDKARAVLIAQLYVRHPHLAVIDPKTGATIETLWSDESAMDLAKIGNDWLCTWASGFDQKAFSELRLLDQKTGKVKGRQPLDKVHTSMAPLDKKVAGTDGFIAMVTADRKTGKVTIRKYSYTGDLVAWVK